MTTVVESKQPKMSKAQKKKARKRANKTGSRRMPMAFTRVSKTSNTITRTMTPNNAIFSGRDLVVPTPDALPRGVNKQDIFLAVPANPVYWTGTRISKLIQSYQMYRPRKFIIHYYPQVAVTNPGSVVFGTLYGDTTATSSSLQQQLATSNGGGMSQCYTRFTSRVDVSRRYLQLEKFNVIGPQASSTQIPFVWVATYTGSTAESASAPGWVEVEWEYELTAGVSGENSTGFAITNSTSEETAKLVEHLRNNGVNDYVGAAPWGVALGLLKVLARPLLKHVSVMLLNGAEGSSFRFGIGKILRYAADNLLRTNAAVSAVVDDDGNRFELPDTTPVVIFESGTEQPKPNAGPDAHHYYGKIVKVDFSFTGGIYEDGEHPVPMAGAAFVFDTVFDDIYDIKVDPSGETIGVISASVLEQEGDGRISIIIRNTAVGTKFRLEGCKLIVVDADDHQKQLLIKSSVATYYTDGVTSISVPLHQWFDVMI